MALLVTCPPASEITDIPVPGCLRDFGQITKAILQRRYSSGTTQNSMTISSTNPNVLATWTALLGASDGTKVQTTPQLDNSNLVSGEPEVYGGGDATAFGLQKITAKNPSSFTAELHAQRQDVVDALDDYTGEIASVYFINEFGHIAGLADSLTSPTTFKGFPIAPLTFFISDLEGGKRNSPDMNKIQWQFFPGWSKFFHVVVPTDFNGNDLA